MKTSQQQQIVIGMPTQLHQYPRSASTFCINTHDVMALQNIDDEMEELGYLGFPTNTRPNQFRRSMDPYSTSTRDWIKSNAHLLGPAITEGSSEWRAATRLLYTWKDLFVTRVTEMPETNLVEHRIPTYPWATPRAAKLPLYTEEEKNWQTENIPSMLQAGIITECTSPWSARTKFPRKASGKLRIVHNFMPINAATIKMNYPLKQLEPILANLSRKR